MIAVIAIPTSIIATFGLIWYQGFTLNSMTMLALTLAVGIVIDDEGIRGAGDHRLRRGEGPPTDAGGDRAT